MPAHLKIPDRISLFCGRVGVFVLFSDLHSIHVSALSSPRTPANPFNPEIPLPGNVVERLRCCYTQAKKSHHSKNASSEGQERIGGLCKGLAVEGLCWGANHSPWLDERCVSSTSYRPPQPWWLGADWEQKMLCCRHGIIWQPWRFWWSRGCLHQFGGTICLHVDLCSCWQTFVNIWSEQSFVPNPDVLGEKSLDFSFTRP